MNRLIKKEISQFFSSITGYVVLVTFIVTTGLFLWVIPGTWNIPLSGYASMDGLFELAPWLFLFLVPAITMGMFSEEFQSGTLELLLVRPLNRLQIVLGKYLAAVVIVVLALMLTLVYYLSIYQMATPVGNVDHGAIWGSYIALFFLGSCYSAIGIFASAITSNQVASFVIALGGCFFMFSGFDLLSEVPFLRFASSTFHHLGVNAHYEMFSKGLIRASDLLYYVSIIFIFIYSTYLKLKSVK